MDQDTVRRSRRAVLGAALGGAAAVAANAVAKPLSVSAADAGNALLGTANTSTTVTSFENTTDSATSLQGVHSSIGTAVRGTVGDTTNAAVSTDENAIYGFADTSYGAAGVWGDSAQGIGVVGSADWGVYGLGGSAAVIGDAYTDGVGVMGYSGIGDNFPITPSGVGVFAAAGSTSQTALQVSGKVKFSRSGRTSIGSTATSKKITMSGVTTSSYILATVQTSVSGVYVRAAVPTTGSFTIYLSKAPGKAVSVGYLVIN